MTSLMDTNRLASGKSSSKRACGDKYWAARTRSCQGTTMDLSRPTFQDVVENQSGKTIISGGMVGTPSQS